MAGETERMPRRRINLIATALLLLQALNALLFWILTLGQPLLKPSPSVRLRHHLPFSGFSQA
jgi:hypothetical protein